MKAATGANQWRNSNDVIKWFEALPNKQSLKFIKFDIDQFYPSITKKIFGEAIEYARLFVDIS